MKIYRLSQDKYNYVLQCMNDNNSYYILEQPSGLNGMGSFKIFTLDKCDNCGGDVELPNAISIQSPLSLMVDSHLKPTSEADYPEAYPCDECGDYYCSNCTCTHGKGRENQGHIIDAPTTSDEMIRFSNLALGHIEALRSMISENPDLKNVNLMPKLFAMFTAINMVAGQSEVDEGYKTQFLNHLRALRPIALRVKNDFMASPSKKSITTMQSTFNGLESLLKEFTS